ncbi:hypothetical protein FSO04_42740 [Paraburkholderia madseniana]|uniref:Uncharacterized protein n=1 Tax=Paraburkholderia madseniana TaxID=2599607 RepID=A0A6N6W175_9BURK|nr:hypothetical protein [Paraburkholderia madseniana]KAE8753869.1 hypothetical protein FSO04_42740 [Paraburkholderia madseniana]
MHNAQQQTSFFSFIHPDHACLPRPVRAFWNTAAVLMFFGPVFMACTSCLGVVLGLASLQEAYPALAEGIALGVIATVKGIAVGFTGLFVTVAIYEREQFAQFVRDDLYNLIEDEVMPLYR